VTAGRHFSFRAARAVQGRILDLKRRDLARLERSCDSERTYLRPGGPIVPMPTSDPARSHSIEAVLTRRPSALKRLGFQPSGPGIGCMPPALKRLGFQPSGPGISCMPPALKRLGFQPSGPGIGCRPPALKRLGFQPSGPRHRLQAVSCGTRPTAGGRCCGPNGTGLADLRCLSPSVKRVVDPFPDTLRRLDRGGQFAGAADAGAQLQEIETKVLHRLHHRA
jgi:hypothetical protein